MVARTIFSKKSQTNRPVVISNSITSSLTTHQSNILISVTINYVRVGSLHCPSGTFTTMV